MSDEETITVECQECHIDFEVPAFTLGTMWKCEACGAVVKITPKQEPQPDPEPEAEPEEDVIYITEADVVEVEPEPEPELQPEPEPVPAPTPEPERARLPGEFALELRRDDDEPMQTAERVAIPAVEGRGPALEKLVFESRLPEGYEAPVYVCLADDNPIRARAIAPVIESITGTSLHTLFTFMNQTMRVVAQTDALHAQKIVDALRFQKSPCFVVDVTLIPELARVKRVNQVFLVDRGLSVALDHKGTRRVIPWESMVAACAGVVSIERQVYDAGSTKSASRSQRVTDKDVQFFLLARRADPADKTIYRFTFDTTSIGYDFLGEEKAVQASVNFKQFCTAFIKRVLTDSVRRVFVSKRMADYVTTALAELPTFASGLQVDWYHRWLLCCVTALRGSVWS